MSLKHEQIIEVFENLNKLKDKGIWFSGIENKGEYKEWYDNGQLMTHRFYNDEGKRKGEYKVWYPNGQLDIHCFFNDEGVKEGEYKEWDWDGQLEKHQLYRNNEVIKDYLK